MRRSVTCAALLAAITAAPGEPRAQSAGVFLEWARADDAGTCIAQADLAARVERRLGRAVFSTERSASTRIAGSVERATTSPRWRGTLRVTRADRPPESREIVSDAPTCRPLSDAITLVLSLLVAPVAADLDPGQPGTAPVPDLNPGRVAPDLNPGQVAPPPDLNPGRAAAADLNPGRGAAQPQAQADLNPGRGAQPQAQADLNPGRGGGKRPGAGDVLRSRAGGGGGAGGEVNLGRRVKAAWGWGGGAGSVLQVGALPGVLLGPRVAGRAVAPLEVPVSLEVHGAWLLGSRIAAPEGGAGFQLLLGGVALCPEIATGHPLRVGGCAGVDAGGVLVDGEFDEDSYSKRAFYAQVTCGAWISLRLVRWLAAGAATQVAVPLLRHRFYWEMGHGADPPTRHLLHRTGPYAGQLEVHLAVQVP